jgi:hypothetical protein
MGIHFETTSRHLRELVREFQTGAVLLPQFQRDYDDLTAPEVPG